MHFFTMQGVAELNVTLGLPRLIEIVDAKKENFNSTMDIYFEKNTKMMKNLLRN